MLTQLHSKRADITLCDHCSGSGCSNLTIDILHSDNINDMLSVSKKNKIYIEIINNKRGDSMKKYEYKCVFICGNGERTSGIMNEYGQQGWEFVNSHWCWHYFKRQLETASQ